MSEEINTYLNISENKYEIFLFDKSSSKNLYKEVIEVKDKSKEINFSILSDFLEKNIFKIEKLIGKFIQNIFLVISNDQILKVNLGIKKKNYDEFLNKKNLENILIEAKDLFRETHQDFKIMHMIINKYVFDGKSYSKFESSLKSDYVCLELEFISIPIDLEKKINKVLEKYQIKVFKYLDFYYIKNLFKESDIEIPLIVDKIQSGYNENEVELIQKSSKKKGFFEKFFQLFS